MKVIFISLFFGSFWVNAQELRWNAFLDGINKEIGSNPEKLVNKISKRMQYEMTLVPDCAEKNCRVLIDIEQRAAELALNPRAMNIFKKDFLTLLTKTQKPADKVQLIASKGPSMAESYAEMGQLREVIRLAQDLLQRLDSLRSASKDAVVPNTLLQLNTLIIQNAILLGDYPLAKKHLQLSEPDMAGTSAERRFWHFYHEASLDIAVGDYVNAERALNMANQLVKGVASEWLNAGWVWIQKSHLARAKGAFSEAEKAARTGLELTLPNKRLEVTSLWAAQALSMALRRQGRLPEAAQAAANFQQEGRRILRPKEWRRFWPEYEVFVVSAMQKKPEVAALRASIDQTIAGTDLATIYKGMLDFWTASAANNASAAQTAASVVEKKIGKLHPDYQDLKSLK